MAGKTVYVGAIHRYPEDAAFLSAFDPLDDLVLHVDLLTARDYVVELLVAVHGISRKEARQRFSRIRPHAQLAVEYIKQSLNGPVKVSFVSGYYALLNLMKVCILCSP